MSFDFKTYSAAGNIIGVAYYLDFSDVQQFVNNPSARKDLKGLAVRNNCDSVMVLVKNGDRRSILEMIVFEPNNDNEYGMFSTMCGNGVRAVAAYAEEYLGFTNWPLAIATLSGVLKIEKLSAQSYRVLMGSIVTNKSVLRAYVNPEYFPEDSDLTDVALPLALRDDLSGLPFSSRGTICSIGFSTMETDADKADGEPHMMIELDNQFVQNIEELKKIAQRYGPIICDNRAIFPLGINVNFVVSNPNDTGFILACTFERNLGDDPQKSVTQACGTGCTFVGAENMRKSGTHKVIAQCLGGRLIIEENDGSIYMSGDARRLEKSVKSDPLN